MEEAAAPAEGDILSAVAAAQPCMVVLKVIVPALRGACGRGDLAYTELCRGHVLGVTGKSIPRKC